MNAYNIMFVILAVLILCSSVATVVTKSIIRAATYLLFVLLGTAGLYFLLGYTFLGSMPEASSCFTFSPFCSPVGNKKN